MTNEQYEKGKDLTTRMKNCKDILSTLETGDSIFIRAGSKNYAYKLSERNIETLKADTMEEYAELEAEFKEV